MKPSPRKLAVADAAAISERLRKLDREILDLRRAVAGEAEAVPPRPFKALEATVGTSVYLIPVAPIEEVVPMMLTQPLPEAPEWVRGTFQLGEDVVPVIDLRRRLDGSSRPCAPESVVIVVEAPERVGLEAATVGEVVEITDEVLQPPPRGIPQAPFLLGAVASPTGGARHLLSVERLARDVLDATE